MSSNRRVVNDLTIQAATVNGSGSQSSNLVLTKAIFRMGIPVAPKNVFPSNIEGLPTWFDVRVSPQGYQCRSREVDILVALNLGTWNTDVAGVKSGGVVIHEAKYPVAGPTLRDDLTYYAVPFAALAKEKIKAAAQQRKSAEQEKALNEKSLDQSNCGSQSIGNIDTGGHIAAAPREVFVFAPNAINVVGRGGCR